MESPRPRRAGFTLVELLVVILIIGILIAIIVPAITAAFRKAKEAQVTAELNNLATALASFKNAYDDYPPSRIILSEEGFTLTLARTEFTAGNAVKVAGDTDTNDTDLTYPQLAQRSLRYLRKFWPRVDFVNLSGTGATFLDFNNNGKNDGYIVLSGPECLVFFLGGTPVVDASNSTVGVSGFGKSPVNPFNAAATNRTVPNYEFNVGRLVDINGHGFPSYLDPIGTGPTDRLPYAYFSAYGTNAYDPNDCNGNGLLSPVPYEQDDSATPHDVERAFSVGYPTSSAGPPYSATSPAPNPYTSSVPYSTAGSAFLNANSYQLICAGQDRLWGLGGQYIANAGPGGRLPLAAKAGDAGNTYDEPAGIRIREADNLSNLANGRLD